MTQRQREALTKRLEKLCAQIEVVQGIAARYEAQGPAYRLGAAKGEAMKALAEVERGQS